MPQNTEAVDLNERVVSAAHDTVEWCKKNDVEDAERAGEKMNEELAKRNVVPEDEDFYKASGDEVLAAMEVEMNNQEHYFD